MRPPLPRADALAELQRLLDQVERDGRMLPDEWRRCRRDGWIANACALANVVAGAWNVSDAGWYWVAVGAVNFGAAALVLVQAHRRRRALIEWAQAIAATRRELLEARELVQGLDTGW